MAQPMTQHGNKKNIPVWCVVKRAVVYSRPGGRPVGNLTFGQDMIHNSDIKSHSSQWIHVRSKQFYSKNYFSGWVRADALSDKEVINLSRLRYKNVSGKRIQTSKRFLGEPDGEWIEPDEVIKAIAGSGNWYLTEKGWACAENFEKCRGIYDYEAVVTVYYNALGRAYEDYILHIKRIKRRRFKEARDVINVYKDLRHIEWWIEGSKYKPLFDEVFTDLKTTREWVYDQEVFLIAETER